MTRVVLAMSGGVDSSVAAHLLCAEGHNVVGVFMRHGVAQTCDTPQHNAELPLIPQQTRGHKQGCCTARDAEDAARVASELGIPFYALELTSDFERIMDYFADEYLAGRTPNPCVQCNNWIKFGKLFEYADSINATHVATGHYARLVDHQGTPALYRGVDQDKDQSYVLFGIAAELLPRMMLPIGDYAKSEIRELAGDHARLVARKKDSQEICFVDPGQHAEFVSARAGQRVPGTIVTLDGTVVGQHDGVEHFTIGQRKGLGVAMGEPHYVVRIDADANQVVVGLKPALARDSLTASRANWFDRPEAPRRCQAQIRYNSRGVPGQLSPIDADRFRFEFDEPCYGVAPGQAVVCYDGERVLGGGWID
ncbi:MAG: tRNA 2-thiouridine(34) synthase MnmA [Planctomycetota bacterium]